MKGFSAYRFSKVRRLALDRDKDICQMCGKKPGRRRLNGHHIYPKSHPKYTKFCYDLDNIITLCSYGCHKELCHAGNTFNDHGWWKRYTKSFCHITGKLWVDPD
jgi:hypothetical protein|tara:strand:+ start:93 stop:404 length:312 start_codon:yes stop_codon:yes gene_type:complete